MKPLLDRSNCKQHQWMDPNWHDIQLVAYRLTPGIPYNDRIQKTLHLHYSAFFLPPLQKKNKLLPLVECIHFLKLFVRNLRSKGMAFEH